MQFIIKADDNSLDLLLEANQYRQMWQSNSRKLLKAFRVVTGLEFQQRTITAYVFKGNWSTAGRPHHPMRLAGDYRSEEFKLATIVHELSHRLLGGNGLGVINLGLADENDPNTDEAIELDHRHLYLFEYDVIQLGLGKQWGLVCKQYEERNPEEANNPHIRAWKWAMSFTHEQRQQILRALTANKVERAQWDEFYDKKIERIDPKEWKAKLSATIGNYPLTP